MIGLDSPNTKNVRREAIFLRLAALLVCIALTIYCLISYIHPAGLQQSAQKNEDEIPAYGHGEPKGDLPVTIAPGEFQNEMVQHAYAAAATIKPVLYQLPCYCGCDRSHRHRHLLDCFTSYHGAHCWACQKEALFAYAQFKQGHSVDEIRTAIIKGEWRK
ncbi:MAG TPA: CYCXC family (seleno)protein [Candidatus Angelobacter sp.]